MTVILALSSMVTRADWQWVPIGAVNNDVQDASAAIWEQDDCELISDAAGAHLDHSGEGVKTSRETDEKQKKAALFQAGVALSQLSANHAEVYHVFCEK
ncbi:hypothetical protein N9Z25_04535 [Luminiphilus sp.]|nr:hypothetical protein [Luminiphilus sp.]